MTKHSVPKTTGGTTGSKQRVSWAGRGAAISWRRRLAKSLQPTHWPTLSQGASASASGMPSLTATPCDSESENLFAGLTRRGRHSFVAGEVTDMDRAACGRHSFCRWRGHGHEPSHGFQAVRDLCGCQKRRCGVSRLDRYALTASRQCVRQQAWTSIAVDKRTILGTEIRTEKKKVSHSAAELARHGLPCPLNDIYTLPSCPRPARWSITSSRRD